MELKMSKCEFKFNENKVEERLEKNMEILKKMGFD